MTTTTTLDSDLTDQVRALRETGLSAKLIARKLGLRPAAVTATIRDLAASRAARPSEPELAGCWVSPGWSVGLSFDGHPDWPDGEAEPGHEGIAIVAAGRRVRSHRISIATFLVDVYCLGVKDAMPPRSVSDSDVPAHLSRVFALWGGAAAAVAAPLDLAQHLVLGAVDYARGLGFEPHPDFEEAAGHLGAWQGPSDITFGQDGVPYYMSGPFDNPDRVMRTLSQSVGDDNYHFMVGMPV